MTQTCVLHIMLHKLFNMVTQTHFLTVFVFIDILSDQNIYFGKGRKESSERERERDQNSLRVEWN